MPATAEVPAAEEVPAIEEVPVAAATPVAAAALFGSGAAKKGGGLKGGLSKLKNAGKKIVLVQKLGPRNTVSARFKAEMQACTPERFEGVPVADEETVRSLSEQLNNQIQKANDDDQKVTGSAGTESFASTPSELFKQMDVHGAGSIAFYEFLVMVRKELRVTQAEVSTDALIGGWKALDKSPTGQGRIDVNKFGKFIIKGRAQRRRKLEHRAASPVKSKLGTPPPKVVSESV